MIHPCKICRGSGVISWGGAMEDAQICCDGAYITCDSCDEVMEGDSFSEYDHLCEQCHATVLLQNKLYDIAIEVTEIHTCGTVEILRRHVSCILPFTEIEKNLTLEEQNEALQWALN